MRAEHITSCWEHLLLMFEIKTVVHKNTYMYMYHVQILNHCIGFLFKYWISQYLHWTMPLYITCYSIFGNFNRQWTTMGGISILRRCVSPCRQTWIHLLAPHMTDKLWNATHVEVNIADIYLDVKTKYFYKALLI